jgi:hypothetical protein
MELRKIMFSLAEVEAALCAYCRGQGTAVTEADIGRTIISDSPRDTVVMSLKRKQNGEPPASLTLRRDEVTESLIQYCIRHRIPLPRAGRKVLWPQEDGISLLVTLPTAGEKSVMAEKEGEKDRDAFAGAAALQGLISRKA